MSSSVLEVFRNTHEDIELMEEAAASALLSRAHAGGKVSTDYSVEFLRNEIQRKALELRDFYDDSESMRSDAIASLAGDGSDVWQSFYSRIRSVKEYYRQHSETQTLPDIQDSTYWYDLAQSVGESKMTLFSGEESGGRFLDMNALHQEYLNLRKIRDYGIKEFVQSQWAKHLRRHGELSDEAFEAFRLQKEREFKHLDYVSWLNQFDSLNRIPRHLKYRQADYVKYLTNLSEYLMDFTRRQRPLLDIIPEMQKFEDEFRSEWASNQVEGWEIKTSELPTYAIVTDRLFATETAMSGHLGSKEYTRAYSKYEESSEEDKVARMGASRTSDAAIARLEGLVRYFKRLLSETVDDTIDQVTRKQARTAREVAEELAQLAGHAPVQAITDDGASDASSSGGEEMDVNDRAIYNPKNLPIGPDGKPIPYWQFRLFGLDKEFPCEICGNHTYFGRRAFEKHFSEWRHINGLKALRIPNSNHFFGITGIEEAINLNDQLRKQATGAIFNADKDMECEDAMGNVMSYKAYQDLMRQGML